MCEMETGGFLVFYQPRCPNGGGGCSGVPTWKSWKCEIISLLKGGPSLMDRY
uniref:Uncharacterized protein n=1 Tax=Daphnia magna TaxID=35525 RepID=A0A0P6EL41_9CRUS